MKRLRFLFPLALLSVLLLCCEEKVIIDLPAPTVVEPEDPGTGGGEGGEEGGEEGGDEGGGQTTPPGAWEANRGKIVTPSGSGWTSKTVADGVVYYAFSGTDPVSNASQHAYAIDLDLSKEQYAVKFTYTSPSAVTSAVHAAHNALATINAGYEAGSIWLRMDGKDKSMMPNTSIGSTGVNNWKSEAAVYGNGERGVNIAFVNDEYTRPYQDPGSNIKQVIQRQRAGYSNSEAQNIISSAPMLVNDYEPVGETFVDYTIPNWSKLNTENPHYHQRHRHPRTAVALTENNHFIMLVVDGRTTASKGMSAKELTQFMVNNFNPQYALNLDGGGSTAMCLEGEGTADTHVVNTPIQDNVPGRERARDTHIMIVRK